MVAKNYVPASLTYIVFSGHTYTENQVVLVSEHASEGLVPLLSRLVAKIQALEFVEMSTLMLLS